MTPLEFLKSKGIKDLSEPLQAAYVELLLEEYSEKIFNEYINVKHFQDLHKFIKLSDYKEEILQSIKNNRRS